MCYDKKKVGDGMNILRKCNLCPRNCMVNRYEELGDCGVGSKIKLALVSLHPYEEPFLSGKNGSGTIFFSHCNVGCIFCQNKKIRDGFGKEITIKRFAEILLEQQERGAHNINLVTPTPYVPLIKKGIGKAKKEGLDIPIVYNTSSYENVSTIKSMEGFIDIYLADFKYYDNKYGEKYSHVSHYFEVASSTIDEMVKQTGKCVIKNNLLKIGVVVRILLLPNLLEDSKKILSYLYQKYQDDIYISIMNQYTPIEKYPYKELNEKVNKSVYNELVNYAVNLGIKNAFIQEGETQKDSFIPDFNLDHIF